MDFPKATPIGATGMAWYRKEDYQQLLKIFVDQHLLPRSFEEWEKKAETGRKKFLADGYIVVRSYIDPNTFPAWCASKGLDINASAPTKFAAEEARLTMLRAQEGGNTGSS
jgi:hypothetical protein